MTPDRWLKAQEILATAAEHEPGSRAAFLEEACRDDPELKEEVESLLSSFEEASPSFMESPAIDAVSALPRTKGGGRRPARGMRLGPYEILTPLGAGGMGEVYRARDERLGREVAIKVLTGEVAADPERLRRFEKEARSASALNHPNIVTIHDIGRSAEGTSFIAMELVDGQTVRELLARGALSTKRLLSIAVQVVDGLAKAHQAGIVHRDLKPENVMVTKDGLVKVLDFGLAKLTSTGSGSGEGSKLPMMTGTTPGLVLGTVGYMSPEQASAGAVDFRSDQFSFGSILYEMATGKRAFERKTGVDTLAAIINEGPESIASVNPQVPAPLRWIVERCHAKEPGGRYSATDDLARELATLRDHLAEAGSGGAPTAAGGRRRLGRPAVLGVFALFLVAAAIFLLTKHPPPPKPPLRVRQLTSNSDEDPVGSGELSPDGKYLAYTDKAGMHIKLIETGEVRSVPEPEALIGRDRIWEIGPWHPDGTRFFVNAHPGGWDQQGSAGTSTWTVLLMGGPPRKLHDEGQVLSVSPDGSLVAFGTKNGLDGDREIWLMGPGGEGARKLYEAEPNESFFGFSWYRDGQRVAYGIRKGSDGSGTRAVSRRLDGGPVKTVFPSKAIDQTTLDRINSGASSPDGLAVYSLPEAEPDNVTSASCNFWELRFDPRTGDALGMPRRLTSWSGFWINASGSIGDGKRLAFLKSFGYRTIYLAPLEASGTAIGAPRHFTLSESNALLPDWTSDSKALVFLSNRGGHNGIYRQSVDSDSAEPVVVGPEDVEIARVSPDGAWIVYQASTPSGDSTLPRQIMRVPIAGGPSQLVLKARPYPWIACARSPASFCALMEPDENRKQLVFTAFDPVRGRGAELARIDADVNDNRIRWDLSPDGTRIAVCLRPEGPIRVFSLSGRPAQEIGVKGWRHLGWVGWAADGNALLACDVVQGTSTLLHVDFRGDAQVLWQQRGSAGLGAWPSRDGRYLAIWGAVSNSNMWMLENF